MSSPNDIWHDGKGKLPEDKLIAYLEGMLAPEEQHEVERWLADEGMEADALEGLSQLSAGEGRQLVNSLNSKLNKKLGIKKHRRNAGAKYDHWAWLAIVIILLLCVAGYLVLHFMVR